MGSPPGGPVDGRRQAKMEDAMSGLGALLPGSSKVAFGELEAALAGSMRDREARLNRRPRASTATVVVVGSAARLAAAIEALNTVVESGSVRTIVIAEGSDAEPAVLVSDAMIAIDGLAPKYLNNAVAALRLPSLPAMIWWRGGSRKALADVTRLADRLVLDTDDPEPLWRGLASLLEDTAITDLRWTRLTPWRSVLAHLFDVPAVQAALPRIHRVEIEAADQPSARLFAAWLRSAAGWSNVDFEIHAVSGEANAPL